MCSAVIFSETLITIIDTSETYFLTQYRHKL